MKRLMLTLAMTAWSLAAVFSAEPDHRAEDETGFAKPSIHMWPRSMERTQRHWRQCGHPKRFTQTR